VVRIDISVLLVIQSFIYNQGGREYYGPLLFKLVLEYWMLKLSSSCG
jgi:hypothetical protein